MFRCLLLSVLMRLPNTLQWGSCPSVHPLVLYGLLTRKQEGGEKPELIRMFPSVPIFSSVVWVRGNVVQLLVDGCIICQHWANSFI